MSVQPRLIHTVLLCYHVIFGYRFAGYRCGAGGTVHGLALSSDISDETAIYPFINSFDTPVSKGEPDSATGTSRDSLRTESLAIHIHANKAFSSSSAGLTLRFGSRFWSALLSTVSSASSVGIRSRHFILTLSNGCLPTRCLNTSTHCMTSTRSTRTRCRSKLENQ
jgi:hypothetical protein